MRNLTLNDVAYGLGIRVYCNDCGCWFDPRKEKNKVRKNPCKHPAKKQKFKSTIIVPAVNGSKRKRKSMTFESRNLNTIISEGLRFKEQVKNEANQPSKKEQKPKLLLECIAMFMDFKNDVDVPKHLRKNLSKGSISAMENYFKKWKSATEAIDENFCEIKVDKISTDNVSSIISLLSNYSNDTQKKAFGTYNQLYRFLNENGYNVKSPFHGIQVSNSASSKDVRSITFEEFTKVKNAMKSGTSKDKIKGRIKYFDWLPEAMDFAALTGRRREEFMVAKFSDIRLVDGKLLGGYILLLDYKYSRQNKHKIGFEPRYTKAPIFPELYDFLIKIGYEKYKDSDRYIIAGDEVKKRITLTNNLTNSFGYYRDKVGFKKDVKLKGLRKKYVTRMRNEFGDNANFFTGHSSERVDKKHYYDDREIFEKIKEFKLW